MKEKIKLGTSACLLGQNVRYDGGNRKDPFLTDTLGRYVDYIPVCPEVECGLGVPREAMRLTGDPEAPRLVTINTHRDLTDRMVQWAKKRVSELEKERLSGFIFKSHSPSSGMEGVNVYNDRGIPAPKGQGIFARIFMEHYPLLPVIDEEGLQDQGLRDHFLKSLFTHQRWRERLLRGTPPPPGDQTVSPRPL